jgi:hypothetical protein
MRYAGNNTNLARSGALTGSNALASGAIYRTDSAAKTGGGLAVVSGDYTGAADTDIDIEIVDTAGSTPQVSDPAFTGVGNGTLTGLTAVGLGAQVITVTLEDLGTDTRKAYAPFQGVTLRAKTAPGNGISISISQAGLSLTSTDFALQEDLTAGTNEYEGTHWDISALGEMTLTPDGKVPTTAPRVVFGADPQVYLAFRKYKDGRYVYGFSPAPVRTAVRGTRIHKVTGTRTLTITDGISTETFTGCGSLYQTLAAIRDGSDLVAVEGLVVNDRLPGGQATVDLSVWTSSYVVGIAPDGSYSCLKADLVVTPLSTAPTEQLTLQCIDSSVTGREVWRADSDVGGRLSNAITNQAYADGPYQFTIPSPEIEGATPGNTTGNIAFSYTPAARGENGLYPNVQAFRPVLGAAAQNGTYEFTLVDRPPDQCAEEGAVSGGPDEDCLGITPPGVENVSDASIKIRLQRLTAARADAIKVNTAPPAKATANDIALIGKSSSILADGLRDLAKAVALDAWEAGKAYGIDDAIEPTTPNGYRYAVTTAGTSDTTEPGSWTTTIGGTVTDGTVTWTNLGKTGFLAWDDVFTTVQNEWAMLAGFGPKVTAVTWSAMVSGAIDGSIIVGSYAKPSTPNGCIYRATTAATALGYATFGDNEPTWPTDLNGSPIDRTATADSYDASATYRTDWILAYRYWQASVPMALTAIARPGNGRVYRVTTAGTTGTSEPTWGTAGTPFSDGTVTWTEIPAVDLATAADPSYFDWLTSAMDAVRAAEGIDSGFNYATVDGDGCWQDPGDSMYWQSTDGYLPAFTNRYYHSSRQFIDADGNPYNQSTYEFGFGIQVGCPENLVVGDKVYITISDVVGSSTGHGYQEGDTFAVTVQNAVPVPFGGGQTGDDTQTWSVVLSDAGRLADYSLVTTALAAYSGTVAAWAATTAYTAGDQRKPTTPNGYRYTATTGTSDASEPTWPTTLGDTVVDGTVTWTCAVADADLAFSITPGGIGFALGDKFVAEIEGGRFKWRRDGGSWSSNIDIATTVLADGLSAVFSGGVAPSWAAGDRWSYRAEATYGAVQMRTPLDGEFEWTGSTVIALAGGAINGIGLYRHRIPEGATITLEGSDDSFSTSPLSVTIPWRRDNLWYGVTANYADYRISIDTSGAIRWLYVGPGTKLQIRTGANEVGRLVKRPRLTTALAPGGLGATISHEWLPEALGTDALLAVLNHAAELNDGLFAIIPNDGKAETGLVRYESDSLDIAELSDYQPSDPDADLRQSLSLTLVAA